MLSGRLRESEVDEVLLLGFDRIVYSVLDFVGWPGSRYVFEERGCASSFRSIAALVS